MAASTAEVNNWIDRVSKNKQPARAARTSDRFCGPDYMSRAGPVSRAVSVYRDLGTFVKRTKTQLCDYMTIGPARLAEIPVSRCRDPG